MLLGQNNFATALDLSLPTSGDRQFVGPWWSDSTVRSFMLRWWRLKLDVLFGCTKSPVLCLSADRTKYFTCCVRSQTCLHQKFYPINLHCIKLIAHTGSFTVQNSQTNVSSPFMSRSYKSASSVDSISVSSCSCSDAFLLFRSTITEFRNLICNGNSRTY